MARSMFNLSDGDNITVDQLNYILGMLRPSNYLLQHHTINGKPLTFSVPDHETSKALLHRPWQVGIVNSVNNQDVCVIKSRQLGLSEVGIEMMIYWLDMHSYERVSGLYAFPTYRQLDTFYKQRIRPEFENGYYRSLIKDPKTMTMKGMKIRDSELTFRTASNGGSLEGLHVDYTALDEYDRISPLAEQSAIQSMESSKYKFLRRWSTPTTEGYGIHKLFQESDQRRWVIKCTHCGYEQVMDYNKNIALVNKDGIDTIGKVVQPGTYQFICQKCHRPLDRWYSGQWVAMKPGKGRRTGFAISQLDAVWITPDHLKQEEMRSPSKQYFYNYNLGMPYQDNGTTFHAEDVLDHIDVNYKHPTNRGNYKYVVCGLDWGEHYHHVVTLGMRSNGRIDLMDIYRVPRSTGVEHIEEDLNLVVRHMNEYQPDLILPDSGYSGSYNQKLMAYYGIDRVYAVRVNSALSKGDFTAHFNQNDSSVTIDKLAQNEIMMGNMRRGDIHFYADAQKDPMIHLFIQHWLNVIIRTDDREDQQTHTVQQVQIITRKDGDHTAQASVYAMVGLDKLMKENALANRQKTQIDYIDSAVFSPEQTDIQKEYDIDSRSVEI